MNKLIAIVGPTAVGKSDLAIDIALEFGGEVVSADSRQIYQGLDIGTGKVTTEEMKGVPHHLLDIREPEEPYSAAEFRDDALEAIEQIQNRDKLPILVGGTGFFISAVVDNRYFPEVPPNNQLREALENKSPEELFEILKEKDPRRADTIDPHNKHRLIRALEITEELGEVPEVQNTFALFETLQIGLTLPDDELRKRIRVRLEKRIDAGMIEEAEKLHKNGLSYERMDKLGLEYRYLAQHLQKHLSLEEMKEKLATEIWRYAKRQIRWFKRDERIVWFTPFERPQILQKIEAFVDSK